jgi:hypothetical protein
MDSHPGDFRAITRGALQTSHGHNVPFVVSDHKFSAMVEKDSLDVVKIREIWLRCGDSSDLAGELVKCPDRLQVRGLITSQNKRHIL